MSDADTPAPTVRLDPGLEFVQVDGHLTLRWSDVTAEGALFRRELIEQLVEDLNTLKDDRDALLVALADLLPTMRSVNGTHDYVGARRRGKALYTDIMRRSRSVE